MLSDLNLRQSTATINNTVEKVSFMLLGPAVELAAAMLKGVERKGVGERVEFYEELKKRPELDPQTARFAYLLGYETIRRLNLIDRALLEASGEAVDELSVEALNILRVYVYWFMFRETTPRDHVRFMKEATRMLRGDERRKLMEAAANLYGFNWRRFLVKLREVERISLERFHPTWFVEYCFRRFGRRFSLDLMDSNNQLKPTYIRVNTLKADEEDVLESLRSEGVRLKPVPGVRYTHRLVGFKARLQKTKAYHKGLFTVQDKASCMAVYALDPKPGEYVMDVCAAPGGKTSLIAQLMENRGIIASIDSSWSRMKLWRKEMSRMGVQIAHPIVGDAANPPMKASADRVLIDPPCSGTGSFNAHPGLKWRVDLKALNSYTELQTMILNSCSRLLKVGGVMVYSTCSVMVEEDEKVVETFLRQNPNFELLPAYSGLGSPPLMSHPGPIRLYPHINGSFGFFIAKLTRVD